MTAPMEGMSTDDVLDLLAGYFKQINQRAARLDEARALAHELLRKERNNAGSGRNGHLAKDDLLPLLKALDA